MIDNRQFTFHVSRFMRISIIPILLLNYGVHPCEAVREGTANANMMIKRYERSQDFGRATLWREAAADCLEIISIPMTRILIQYYIRQGKDELAALSRRELADIEAQRQYHLERAKAYWAKSKTEPSAIDAEREKIAQFIATWVPHYPDKFYDFGIYANFFKKQRETLVQKGDYATALNLEADAADMCAEQYNDIPIAYFKREAERAAPPPRMSPLAPPRAGGGTQTKIVEEYRQRTAQYEKVRDAHRRRAALLRALARGKPKSWPPEADMREIEPPKTKTQLTSEAAIRTANSDSRLQQILATHKGVHEYAWFQGFAWTVSYYNHGWGNLAIVMVDDQTGKVIDVLNEVGNLEGREWEKTEGREKGELRLQPEQVEQIARNHDQIASYFRAHPEVRLSPTFNERYQCWMVEVIEADKEVGFVSISDQTGKVLEVTLDQPEQK